MADLSVMTELEAVNEMLLSIGQSPVNTLEVTGIRDVSIAKSRLSTALRKTLARGWAFNTDEAFELTPDADGYILIPSNALKVIDGSGLYTTRRDDTKGICLWNKSDNTFIFDDAVSLKIIRAFDFEDIPQVARDYVAVVAARRFQSKSIGSQVLDRFEEEDELKAWADLMRAERAGRQTNLFTANQGLQSFGDRSH